MDAHKIIKILLQNSKIFKEFSEEEMVEILKLCKSRSYRPGEIIIIEDSLGSDFFVIVTGSIIIKKKGKIIDILRTGECFGEMGAIWDAKRSATTESEGDAVLLDIDVDKISQLDFEIQAKLYKNIALVLADRLRKRIDDIVK